MAKQEVYEILNDVFKNNGATLPALLECETNKVFLEDIGVDQVAFSEIKDELEKRYEGKRLNLENYLNPTEFPYLTVAKLLEHLEKLFVTTNKNPLVVYVDDEEDNLFVFNRKLGKKITLKTFTKPLEALEFIRTNSDVALVITDEVMPLMGGNELCDEVHKTKPYLKFILITGNPDDDSNLLYKSLRHNRFYEFINKPLDLENKSEEYLNLVLGLIYFAKF